MTELMIERFGPANVASIFHEDAGEGFFFLYDATSNTVLRQVRLYERPTNPVLEPSQIEIMWSNGDRSSGLVLWGRMRCVLPIEPEDAEIVVETEQPADPAVDAAIVQDFPQYVDRRMVLDARKRYWTELLKRSNPAAVVSEEPLPLTETAFMRASYDSPRKHAAIFEDDHETGYLYLLSTREKVIVKHLHLYDRGSGLSVAPNDVEVLWSTDESKCAVLVWGRVRGIIDLGLNKEARVWLENRNTPGVSDRAWLKGFELM